MTNKTKKKDSNLKYESDKDEKLKRLESDIIEIKNKFEEAESIAKFGFWEVDPATLNPTWTKGVFNIVGYDPEYGQPKYFDQRKLIHPDDWNLFFNTLQHVLKTGKDDEFDVRIIKPDTSEVIIHIIARPKKDENGNVIGVRGTAQDITELRRIEKELEESEVRYRYMVENAAAGMFILDKNGIIKYLNDHMAQMLDYTKNEMLEGHIKTFVDEDNGFFRYRKPIDNKIERYNWFKFLDRYEKVFWSNLTVSPIFNSNKEYTGCLGIVTDINMQKGLEEAFLEREEIFTDIIYDMMEMLNNVTKGKKSSDILRENLDNN